MENERNLASTLAHISASEDEMSEYRARLSRRMSEQPRPLRWSFIWVPLTALTVLALFLISPTHSFGPETFDDLQTWVTEVPDAQNLEQKALKQLQKGHGTNQLNAMMVLCLMRSGEDAMNLAAQALVQENRPAFRTFYLEFLLDHADRYAFNPEFIEGLMDRERDPVCLKLMKGLLSLG